ncbi:MAG: hypothetical protein H6905_07945 [Hyphomicrobiales bacterium]|nr:hypothetical protein [Hyphomicrobiales bacterium]
MTFLWLLIVAVEENRHKTARGREVRITSGVPTAIRRRDGYGTAGS